METPETIRTSLQQGEWVTSIDFKDVYFHIPIQEQSRKYLRFHVEGLDIPVQGTAIWFVHSTHGVHCDSKGGEADGHTQGYKDLPVPRQLVGESQIPPGLSPAYTGSSENVSKTRLAGELGKIRIGTQAGFQLCRLPVRPQVRLDPTDTRPVADSSGQSIKTAIPTGLSSLAIHVPDRSVNSYRVHLGRLHMRPLQWYLKNNWRVPETLEKVIPIPRSLHPHLIWWLKEDNGLTD